MKNRRSKVLGCDKETGLRAGFVGRVERVWRRRECEVGGS